MFRALLLSLAILLLCSCGDRSAGVLPEPGPDPVGPRYAVSDVSIDRTSVRLAVGASTTLAAGVSPRYASNKEVSWSSDDPDVATVGLLSGEVTAVAPGETVITATTMDGGHKASCTVRVE